MTPIAFAWITTVLYAASFLIGKYATKHKIANPWLYNFIWASIIVVLSVTAALVMGAGVPASWDRLILAGALSALASVTYTISVYLLDASVLGPLYIIRTPISVILGLLLFSESLTLVQVLLIAVITVTGMFVSMDETMNIRSFFRKPIAFALGTIVISALYAASVKYAGQTHSYWTTILWMNVFTFVFLLSTIPLFRKDIARVKKSDFYHVSLSAILGGIGGITFVPALAGNLGITTAIISLPLGTVSAVALSRIAPHWLETHSGRVYTIRLVGALVMFLAALGLSR